MIQMTYDQLMAEQFTNAIRKIANMNLHPRQAYAVKKIGDKLNLQRQKIVEEYRKDVTETFAKRDEQGGIAFNPMGGFEVADESKEQFAKAQAEFGKRIFTLDRERLVLEQLGDIKLSAVDLTFLEPIIISQEDAQEEAAQEVAKLAAVQ
jgi:hypothetical protein